MRTPSSLKGSRLVSGLRQNRLLPVIILLVVAIAAVPLLLKSDPPPAPPLADPTVGIDDSNEAVPAVFVDSEGVRDYRRRLDLLQSKNPFDDHFGVPAEVVKDVGGVTETPEVAVPDTSAAPPPADSGGDVSIDVVEPDASVSDEPATETEVIVKEKEVQLSYRVDLEVGLAGQPQRRENVKSLTVLPSKSRPVVIFNGVSEDGEEAVFMVSSDVTGSAGDGACIPSAADCQILTMEQGERRELTYAPEGEPESLYVLRLRAINRVVISSD